LYEEVGAVKFDKVSPQVDFPRLEEEILGLWRETNVFEKSVNGRP
jgi:isoleucyl-tRNA synthetase